MLMISRDILLYPVGPVGCAPHVSSAKKSSTCKDGGRDVLGGRDRNRSPLDGGVRAKPRPRIGVTKIFFSGRPVDGSTSTRRVRKHGAVVVLSRFDCGEADRCRTRLQSDVKFVSGGRQLFTTSFKSHGMRSAWEIILSGRLSKRIGSNQKSAIN